MATVVPTILATDPADFAARIERVQPFVSRLHIDVADGVFASPRTPNLAQVYGVPGAQMDFHLMVHHPGAQLENIVSLKPSLVIVHFEAEGDHMELLRELGEYGIRCGLAILPETAVEQVASLLPHLDHLLVFTGTLGHNGGEFRREVLPKIAAARKLNPKLEIGVDGGVGEETAPAALAAGADVLYVGSAVHGSDDPPAAFRRLEALAAAPRPS